MSNYYSDVQKANRYIDQAVQEKVFRNGEELDLNELKLKLTSIFPVGDKVVDKRIELLAKVYPSLRLVDDKILDVGGVE